MDQTVPSTTTPDVQLLKDRLATLVRQASLSRLLTHANAPHAEIRALDSGFRPGRMLANHMVFILVSNDALRLTFKVHFNTRTARSLAFGIFGGASPSDIPERQAVDYFKEYGNLVAGNVISLLGQIDVELGISLPLATRGFYEVFSDYTEKQHPMLTFSDFWGLHVDDLEVFCSAQFEVMDKNKLAGIADHDFSEASVDEDEELDFL